MKKIALYLGSLIILVLLLVASLTIFQGSHPAVHASTSNCQVTGETCLSGWAWSPNVGWISFNSNDQGAGGGPYEVKLDSSGNFSGYAWSSNIGWISFNASDISGCNGSTGANVSTSSGNVAGWGKTLSESGRESTDGWDGCIELSGSNHSSPDFTGNGGVTYASSTGIFSGYAWGGGVVGWLQFNASGPTGSTNPVICTGPNCGGGGTVGPALAFTASNGLQSNTQDMTGLTRAVAVNSPVSLNWNIQNLTGCQKAGSDWANVSNTSSISSSQPGNGTITFSTPTLSNTGSRVALIHTLALTCNIPNSGFPPQTMTQTVRIDVVQQSTNPQNNICPTPVNTSPCPNSNNLDSSQLHIYSNGDSVCQTTTNSCQFQCLANFKYVNGSCVKSSLQEL